MDLLNSLIDFITDLNFRKLKGFLIVVILIVFVFPAIDANYLYFYRINNRIDVLDKISNLDVKSFEDSKILNKEYEEILDEIDNFEGHYLISNNNIFNQRTPKTVKYMKIISGSLVFTMLFIVSLFRKLNARKKIKLLVLTILLGSIGGYIGYMIPTFRNHYINYIGTPVLILVAIYSMGSLEENKSEIAKKI